MPSYIPLTSTDKYKDRIESNGFKTIVINELSALSSKDINVIKDNIQTSIRGGKIDTVPQCYCGNLHGTLHLGRRCLECNSDVMHPYDKLDPYLWAKVPESIDYFISPLYWTYITHILYTNKIDILQYMTNSSYKTKQEIVSSSKVKRKTKKGKPIQEKAGRGVTTNNPIINYLNRLNGFKRDYNYFIQNFVELMTYLRECPEYRKVKKQQDIDRLILLWNTSRNEILNRYIPITHSRLFIKEHTSTGIYTSFTSSKILSSTLSFISKDKIYATENEKGNTVSKLISGLSEVFTIIIDEIQAKKEGGWRQHIFRSKATHTFRAVIKLKTTGRFDGLGMPYGMMVALLQPQIMNRLRRLGYSPLRAKDKFFSSVLKFDQVVYDIMCDLNKEAYGGKGMSVIFLRNPVLYLTSILYMNVEYIKTDAKDNTIDYHILVTSAPNADFDGGETSVK